MMFKRVLGTSYTFAIRQGEQVSVRQGGQVFQMSYLGIKLAGLDWLSHYTVTLLKHASHTVYHTIIF